MQLWTGQERPSLLRSCMRELLAVRGVHCNGCSFSCQRRCHRADHAALGCQFRTCERARAFSTGQVLMLTPRDAWFGDASNRSLGDSLTWIRTPSRRLRQCVALAARELTDYFSSLDHGNPVVMLSSLCCPPKRRLRSTIPPLWIIWTPDLRLSVENMKRLIRQKNRMK